MTAGENAAATVVNVVRGAPVADDHRGSYAAAAGKFIVNHIPTDSKEPLTIESPCELLDDVAVPDPVLQNPVSGPNRPPDGRGREEGEEEPNGR